jgi:uncharacterized membrane protein YczE
LPAFLVSTFTFHIFFERKAMLSMSDCALRDFDVEMAATGDAASCGADAATVRYPREGLSMGKRRVFRESAVSMPVRIALLLIGIPVMSLGINVIVWAGLGNSPISATPYVASLAWPGISFGTFLALWHVVLIAAQIIVLRRDFRPADWLQVPVTLYFGMTTDLTALPFAGLQSVGYVQSLLLLFVGICCLALGVSCLIISNTVMNCGEAFVRALNSKLHKKFGTVKVCVDLSFVVCAALLSLVVFGHIEGVREGSLICAALTGAVVNVITPRLSKLFVK